jgi:hypothetical protein
MIGLIREDHAWSRPAGSDPGSARERRLCSGIVDRGLDLLAALLATGQRRGADRRGILSVEAGGSGTEYVLGYFGQPSAVAVSSSPPPGTAGLHTCFAAPGRVTGGRVQGALQLGWMDVNGWAQLGFAGEPGLSMNDAEAAALGEWILRDRQPPDLVYVGLGTGVGSARVTSGMLVPLELAHRTGYGAGWCEGCRNRCVNGQIGSHAVPDPLTAQARDLVVRTLSAVLTDTPGESGTVVVIGGGMARSHPAIVSGVRTATGLTVEPSRAGELKSAASIALFDRVIRTMNSGAAPAG